MSEPTAPYIPVPVEAARDIAEKYGKSIVIIFSYDPAHGLLHTTTYGTDPQNKAWAAQGGEIGTEALGGLRMAATDFEDYRLEQAANLLAALKSAIKITEEAFEAWDNNKDMRCGKILRHLCDPDLKGYRADIDRIHETVKTAEKFLTLTCKDGNA